MFNVLLTAHRDISAQ